MAKFTDEQLHHLARLCRIETTAQDRTDLAEKLQRILSYMEMMKEVKTEGVPPTYHVIDSLMSVLGDDEVGELMSQGDFLKNAPANIAGMVKIPTVIKPAP